MIKKNKFLSLLMGVIAWSAIGQQQPETSCSFSEIQQEYYDQNPDALYKAKEFEKVIFERQASEKSSLEKKSSQKHVIPVVFHIYGTRWPDGSEGNNREVTDERIKQSLEQVNKNFKGFNDSVDSAFKNIEGGMNIEFRLAQIDPNGNTTSGIIYHEEKKGFGLNSVNDLEIAKYAWDNYKYMNVHIQLVLKGGTENNSGIAWFPDKNMSDKGTARVVYNGKYIIYSPPASSLTHEFGHYLGLHHTFNGGCIAGSDKGDKVEDTPPSKAGLASISGKSCKTDVKNCFGNLINYQNHMDYNPCESMFTKGQVSRMESFMNHEARVTLWQQKNLEATGTAKDLGPRVLFTYQGRKDNDIYKTINLVEGFNNNGVVPGRRKIKAVDGAKFTTIGKLKEGVHFSVEGVPAGLTAKLKVLDKNTAEIHFDGTATEHQKKDSSAAKITLLDAAIEGGVSAMYSKTGTYNIQFLDIYVDHYEMFEPFITMGHSMANFNEGFNSKFNSLAIEGGVIQITLKNFNGNNLVLGDFGTTYEVLCNPNSHYVKYLSEGVSVQKESGNWTKKGEKFRDPAPLISSSEYTFWKGKKGYIGIRVPTVNNSYLYGWLKTEVTKDGKVVIIKSMGVNPKYGDGIETGIKKQYIEYYRDRFVDLNAYDNTIGSEIIIELKNGASLAVNGKLKRGTHYKVTNEPDNYQLDARAIGDNKIRLSIKGSNSYEWTAKSGINFELLDPVFASGNASDVLFTSYNFGKDNLGKTFSKVLPKRVFDSKAGKGNLAGFVIDARHLDKMRDSYQFQHYKEDNIGNKFPGVKFISWRKDAIANDNYELLPLDKGVFIGPESQWKNGQEFWKGRGQHMIDSKTYQVWRGKTKYVGIRIRRSGQLHYGWIKLKVSSDGRFFQYLEYGLCGIPGVAIKAGTIDTTGDTPTCNDGVQNGDETGIDCGGPSCEPCLVASNYCDAYTEQPEDLHITNVTFGNINNSSSHKPYSDYTNISTTLQKGEQTRITVNASKTWDAIDVVVWIDWNNDKNFNKNERMDSELENGSYTTNVTPPSNAVLNTPLRMRIRMAYGGSVSACGKDTYLGEVEDYSVIVGQTNGETDSQAPSAPLTLSASDIQETSVSLSWGAATDNVGVTGYNVYQGEDIIVNTVTSTSASITGLSPNTTYQFRVKAKDTAGNVSDYSNTVDVKTGNTADEESDSCDGIEDWDSFRVYKAGDRMVYNGTLHEMKANNNWANLGSCDNITKGTGVVRKLVTSPNPTEGVLNINLKTSIFAKYTITSMLGKVIQSGKLEPSINVSNLQKGVYFINVYDKKEKLTSRFIKK